MRFRNRRIDLGSDRDMARLVAMLSQDRLITLTSLTLTRMTVMEGCDVVEVLEEAAEGLRQDGLDPRWRDLLAVAGEHQ